MADRGLARQPPDDVVLVEIAGDMALGAMAVEIAPVPAGDAGCFLAAMLERVEAERDDRGGGIGAPDAEHAALLAQLVVGKGMGGQHGRGPRRSNPIVWKARHIGDPPGFVAGLSRIDVDQVERAVP
jgi:hypothetical protein